MRARSDCDATGAETTDVVGGPVRFRGDVGRFLQLFPHVNGGKDRNRKWEEKGKREAPR